MTPCASQSSTSRKDGLCFILIVGILLSRFPSIWMTPRFWGEEATHYFSYALTHSWLDTITKEHQGYYALLINLATWLATKLPFEHAPFATQLVALAVQLLPLALLAFGRFTMFPSDWSRWLAAITVLFVTHSDEIWLNSVTSHYHLSLALFLLVMMETPERKPTRIIYVGLFALSGLASIPACFLLPMAVVKAYRKRNKTDALACALLAIGCALQLYVVISAFAHPDQPRRPLRIDGFPFVIRCISQTIGAIWTGNLDTFKALLYRMRPFLIGMEYRIEVVLAMTWALCLSFGALMYVGLRILPGFEKTVVVYGFFAVLLLSLITSLDGMGGLRYTYAPNIILMLLLIANVDKAFRESLLVRAGVSSSLVLGALAVWIPIYYTKACCYFQDDWPVWSEQVALYRSGEIDKIAITPEWSEPAVYFEVPQALALR